MKGVLIDDGRASEWDAFVKTADSFAMTQSWDWGELKRDLGWEPNRVAVEHGEGFVCGAMMLLKKLPMGAGSIAHVPRGPVGDWRDPAAAAELFGTLHTIARDKRCVFLKVEPPVIDGPDIRDFMGSLDFRPSPHPIQPEATIIIDLTDDLDTILLNMRKSTRRKVKDAEKKGVEVRRGTVDEFSTFYDLMAETAERTGITLRGRDYYEAQYRIFDKDDQVLMLLADYEGETVAATVTFAFGEHAAFFHQASSSARSNLNPNCLLVWEQIKWAKDRGCRTLDLWGLPGELREIIASGGEPPADRTDGQWGVYRFKAGFSHNLVVYAGSFDYVYAPKRYALASSQLAGDKKLEKLSSWIEQHASR